MAETDDSFEPPAWVGLLVLGSGALALLAYVVGGALLAQLARASAVLAVLGFVYLLYLWGQQRDPPSGGGGDDGRREKEMEAEAGGYGGSGGGA